MENIRLMIGGRKIPLRFRMNQFIEIEETIGNLGEVKALILNGQHRLVNLVRVIRILGNAGLKSENMEPDLTEDWLKENMDPHALRAYQIGVLACLTQESYSEATAEENENKERDLVLEEINAKKDPVNSHTGE